jgi:hypothetical protein
MLPRLEVTLPLLSITNTGGIPTVTPPTKPKGSNAIVHPNIFYYIFIIWLYLFTTKKTPVSAFLLNI